MKTFMYQEELHETDREIEIEMLLSFMWIAVLALIDAAPLQ